MLPTKSTTSISPQVKRLPPRAIQIAGERTIDLNSNCSISLRPQPRRHQTRVRSTVPALRSLRELHEHKGLPYDSTQDGFVFSKAEIEEFARRTMRLNQAWRVEAGVLHGARMPRMTLRNDRAPIYRPSGTASTSTRRSSNLQAKPDILICTAFL
jgi:hypothetical protein